LKDYAQRRARFAKWRAVIHIGDGIPTSRCVLANAQALARYAALCQERGLVPIIKPEVAVASPDALHAGTEEPKGGQMKPLAKVMSFVALSMTTAMVPQATAQTPPAATAPQQQAQPQPQQ
jgi:fructose-bisphosphate aldolase class 1